MVGLTIKLFEAVNERNYTVCAMTLGWQPWLCMGVQFHFPWYVFIEDTRCHVRRSRLPVPFSACPGRWLRPPTVFWEATAEQQEERWNGALEIPDMQK